MPTTDEKNLDTRDTAGASREATELPDWLLSSEQYDPPRDRDGFIGQSLLSVGSVLARLRMDDGQETRLSPSAPVKLLVGLGCILLVSLSRNYAFVLLMLAATLVRVALLPAPAIRRAMGVALSAAGLTLLIMAPAVLLGQAHSPLLVGTKVLTTVAIALTVTASTPLHDLTAGLRAFHVPNIVILTLDLTLKSIVTLGQTASEVLVALRLRSVGRNDRKASSMGGVGGVTFLKANQAARDTADAMRCRGFEGDYDVPGRRWLRPQDGLWAAGLVVLICIFVYLEGAVA